MSGDVLLSGDDDELSYGLPAPPHRDAPVLPWEKVKLERAIDSRGLRAVAGRR